MGCSALKVILQAIQMGNTATPGDWVGWAYEFNEKKEGKMKCKAVGVLIPNPNVLNFRFSKTERLQSHETHHAPAPLTGFWRMPKNQPHRLSPQRRYPN